MGYICKSCGTVQENFFDRCPNCLGELQAIPSGMPIFRPCILDSQALKANVDSDIQYNLAKADKAYNAGGSHITNGYFDSAATEFRKVMEYILQSYLLLISGDKYFYELRIWICWQQDLCCKLLNEVKFKPADEIRYLKDVGLIGQATFSMLQFLRETGNRGAHAGGGVAKEDALKAKGYAEAFIKSFKEMYANMFVYTITPAWQEVKRAQETTLKKYLDRLEKDRAFLTERNINTQSFIDRKTAYLKQSRSWARANETQKQIDEAKQQFANRKREIDAIDILKLQIHHNCELLHSVYDPQWHEQTKTQRLNYHKSILEEKARENKTRQTLTNIAICVGGGAIVLVILLIAFG